MSSIVDHAVERLRNLPSDVQEDVARTLLDLMEGDHAMYRLSEEERADLDEADAEIARKDFATDDEVAAVWARHSR